MVASKAQKLNFAMARGVSKGYSKEIEEVNFFKEGIKPPSTSLPIFIGLWPVQ